MALYRFGKRGKRVRKIPNQMLFDGWKSWLNPFEIRAINDDFNGIIADTTDSKICTASLLPANLSRMGSREWEGSPFVRIWDKACRRDQAHTCWCFALFLWEHMMNRPDAWNFRRFDLDDVPMAATCYYPCLVHNQRRNAGSVSGPATSIV